MNSREPNPDDGRLALAVGGLLFIPLSIGAIYGLNFEVPAPQGPLEWGIRIFLDELAIAAALFFGIGFLWAITGSRSLKRLLDRITVKFAWLFIPIAIPALLIAAGVAWSAVFR